MSDFNWQEIVSDNVISFLIGTVVLGTIFDAIRRAIDYVSTQKYRGWTLQVRPQNDQRKEYFHELLWDEVRRFERSPFENRKFIQSVCTSEGFRLKAGLIPIKDSNSWVFRDDENKFYKFDFTKVPKEVGEPSN